MGFIALGLTAAFATLWMAQEAGTFLRWTHQKSPEWKLHEGETSILLTTVFSGSRTLTCTKEVLNKYGLY